MAISDTLEYLAATLAEELPLLREAIGGAVNYGAAWPSGWAAHIPFFRTDLHLWCYNDATRWLTCDEYVAPLNEQVIVSGGDTFVAVIPAPEYSVMLTRFDIRATTVSNNNSSNYWVVKILADGAQHSAHDLRNDGTDTIVHRATPNVIASPAQYLGVFASIIGSPGMLYLASTVRYRLIIP